MIRRSGSTLRAAVAGLAAAALLLVGCSSDGGDAAIAPGATTATTSTSTTVPTTSSTTSSTTTSAPPTTVAPPSTTTTTGGAAPAPAPGLVAPQGYRSVTLVVTMPDGSTREWCVWIADTPALRSRGLMQVSDPGLGGRAGMAFVFETDTSSGFWMKNTLLPLSIAWFRADGSFVSSADMDPCPASAATCPSTKPAGAYRIAIEVPQGMLEQVGLLQGATISLGGSCGGGSA